MGDKEAPSYRHFDDLVFLSDISDDFNTSNVVLSESELLEEYGIEIVSVTELIPIENSFE